MNNTLRPYQKEALEKILWSYNSGLPGNDLVIMPTASGKSLIISSLANTLNEPILILQPSREILEQNLEKLLQYVDRSEIGIFSASMNEKIVKYYTFATIQSIYRKPELFSHFKFIVIDECHLVNIKNLNGMFASFLNKIGNPKVIGLTATPYRMESYYIREYGSWIKTGATIKLINRMKGYFWKRILFNISMQELLDQGYLCPLKYIDMSVVKQEDLALNASRTGFDMDKYEKKILKNDQEIINIIRYAEGISKSVLVFCSSVKQAEKLAEIIEGSAVVSALTDKKDRKEIISDFKVGKIKTVFNVQTMTTGFDHSSLDCIILLRPTRSLALLQQMLGRGMRIAEGKKFCRVIDMTSTIKNIGKIETIKLVKNEGKWELESETKKNWHGEELYIFRFQQKKLELE